MSLYPLWKNTNKTEFSSVFSVPPGQVCVLFASGLQKYKYRVDASEVQVPQVFCVRRLLHNFTFPVDKANLPCGWIFDTENQALMKSLMKSSGLALTRGSCRCAATSGLLVSPVHTVWNSMTLRLLVRRKSLPNCTMQRLSRCRSKTYSFCREMNYVARLRKH